MELKYKALNKFLKETPEEKFPSICLIHGEEALCKSVMNAVLDALLPGQERGMNHESVDNDNVFDAIERVNTYSLLGGTKVVSLPDSQVFYSKREDARFIEKAKKAFDSKDMKAAAKAFATMMGRLGMSYEEFRTSDRAKVLNIDSDLMADGVWLDKLLVYCVDNAISVPAKADHSESLLRAVEKGFPEGNHLIVTTDVADKRRVLYKAIEKSGLVVDCSVPAGSRKADRDEQVAVLREKSKEVLAKSGKTLAPDAFHAILELTGFDIRTFSNNLEQLATFVGDRKAITVKDAESLLKRTKKDPIYEFTGAVADRNAENALFYLESLLSSDYHALQLLSAITNQIRKLLVAKDFVESDFGKTWRPGATYFQFRDNVMPDVLKYDGMLLKRIADLSKDEAEPEKTKGKKGKKKAGPATDLTIAKNPRSPYPVYSLLKSSDKFTKPELLMAMEWLGDTDLRLKSTGQDPKLVLEEMVLKICLRSGGTRS